MMLHELPTEFRRMADRVRIDAAAEQAARAYERAAELAQEALSGHLDEELTRQEAVVESGYTWNHLCRLNRQGTLPFTENGGILRRHLPRKPGYGVASDIEPAPSSRTQVARAVLERTKS